MTELHLLDILAVWRGCFSPIKRYKYYSTQRPIDIGTYPKSYFNSPIHMDVYFTRQQVPGEAFQAWGRSSMPSP